MSRKKVIAILLCSSMILPSSTILASTRYSNSKEAISKVAEVSEDSVEDTSVYAEVASVFTAVIPKELSLSGETKEGHYSVLASGDIAGDEYLLVEPESTFAMESKNLPKVTANVSQDVIKLRSSLYNKPLGVSEGKFDHSYEGVVTADGLTAGKWEGAFNFNIKLSSDSGDYSFSNVKLNSNNLSVKGLVDGDLVITAKTDDMSSLKQVSVNGSEVSSSDLVTVDDNTSYIYIRDYSKDASYEVDATFTEYCNLSYGGKTEKVAIGDIVSLAVPEYDSSRYEFLGWSGKEDSIVQDYVDTIEIKDSMVSKGGTLTLYPVYLDNVAKYSKKVVTNDYISVLGADSEGNVTLKVTPPDNKGLESLTVNGAEVDDSKIEWVGASKYYTTQVDVSSMDSCEAVPTWEDVYYLNLDDVEYRVAPGETVSLFEPVHDPEDKAYLGWSTKEGVTEPEYTDTFTLAKDEVNVGDTINLYSVMPTRCTLHINCECPTTPLGYMKIDEIIRFNPGDVITNIPIKYPEKYAKFLYYYVETEKYGNDMKWLEFTDTLETRDMYTWGDYVEPMAVYETNPPSVPEIAIDGSSALDENGKTVKTYTLSSTDDYTPDDELVYDLICDSAESIEKVDRDTFRVTYDCPGNHYLEASAWDLGTYTNGIPRPLAHTITHINETITTRQGAVPAEIMTDDKYDTKFTRVCSNSYISKYDYKITFPEGTDEHTVHIKVLGEKGLGGVDVISESDATVSAESNVIKSTGLYINSYRTKGYRRLRFIFTTTDGSMKDAKVYYTYTFVRSINMDKKYVPTENIDSYE